MQKSRYALSSTRSQSFMNQAAARGVQAAGETGGGAGLAMFGAGMGAAGGMVNPVQPWAPPGQQDAPQQAQPHSRASRSRRPPHRMIRWPSSPSTSRCWTRA